MAEAKSGNKGAGTKADAAKRDEAKVGPVKYVGQVRQEARKVTWPTRRETVVTTVLVMIMVIIMGTFFFFVDWILAVGIRIVLGLGGTG